MKQYFPKFVFKYQLSLNTVNLHTKTGNMFVNNVQKQTFWLPNVYKCEQNTFIFLTNVQKRIFSASNVDNFKQNTIQKYVFGPIKHTFYLFGPN